MECSTNGEMPGKLIAVEGLDGSGKSTQVHLLKRWLELTGRKVFLTEWNSSKLVKQATRRGKKQQILSPMTFSLIHCTDFADRYEQQILPLLSAGYIVLADRYIYTAFARDAVRGCAREWVRDLYSYARHPDLTLFFNTPLNVALSRILEGRPKLKYHEAGMDMGYSSDPYESFRIFQGKIYQEYLNMAETFHFALIDATKTVHSQQRIVREMVNKNINLEQYKWTTA